MRSLSLGFRSLGFRSLGFRDESSGFRFHLQACVHTVDDINPALPIIRNIP